MKQKILSLCCVLALVAGMALAPTVETNASEETQPSGEMPMIDGSYLTHEKESIGYDTKITRGKDLLAGYSKCVVVGKGRIYGGGTTIATQTVDRIGLSVAIERAQEGDDHWTWYTAWQKFKEDADRLAVNKYVDVEGGYYYRVSSIHSAGNDVSDSFTNGVYVE